MAFKCKIGLHSWNGCKCSECGKNRDEQHVWRGCKCAKCGETRDEQHDWSLDCEKCSKCGKQSDYHHVWNGCICNQCGKVRNEFHDWAKDCEKCSKCSLTRKNQHDWSKDCDKCSKCGRIRENQHDWSKDCEKCSKCGKIRMGQHDWSKDCETCSRCGKTRDNQHVLEDCVCKKCGKTVHKWVEWENCICSNCGTKQNHYWSKDLEYCINCSKISGISKHIVQFEFMVLYKKLESESSDPFFPLTAKTTCTDKIIVKIKEKYNCDLKPWDILDSEMQRILADYNDLKSGYFSLNTYNIEKLKDYATNDLKHIDFVRKQKDKLNYFEQKKPEKDMLCTLDNCSCSRDGSIIPKGKGYLYITASNVNTRKDCLTFNEFQNKLQIMLSKLPEDTDLVFSDVPILVCEKGIDLS